MKIKQDTFGQPLGQRRNQKGNRKYFETKRDENKTYQNLWDEVKAVLRCL